MQKVRLVVHVQGCGCRTVDGAVRWTVPVLGLNTTGESMTVSCTSVTYFPL